MIFRTFRNRFIATAVTDLTSAGIATPTTWKIDPVHSSVSFTARHFVAKVPGSFGRFEGSLVFDQANPSASRAEVTIRVGSMHTHNDKRDAHLLSDDFFSAEKFPDIKFRSRSWTGTGKDNFSIVGDLTIRNVTREVTLAARLLGIGPGADNHTLSGWKATTRLDRRDFGITYLPAVIGSEVDITINVEAIKQ